MAGGRGYECLAVEVPEFAQRDSVAAGGLLVPMTVPDQETVIDLLERSPESLDIWPESAIISGQVINRQQEGM